MNEPRSVKSHGDSSRREFLKASASAGLAVGLVPAVHAAGTDTVRIALVGCGGRGTGAALNALQTKANVRLVAVADAFGDRIDQSLKGLAAQTDRDRVDVPEDRRFVGLDAYQRAIESGVEAVLLCTPPGFRPAHFEAAVRAGKHVFMEKPVATDAPGVRRVLAANEEAKRKGLAVAVGHQVEMDDFFAAIQSGEPYNEADYGSTSTMTAILGRMASYSGKIVGWDEAFNSNLDLMPKRIAWDAQPPIQPGPDGLYACAMPGVSKAL